MHSHRRPIVIVEAIIAIAITVGSLWAPTALMNTLCFIGPAIVALISVHAFLIWRCNPLLLPVGLSLAVLVSELFFRSRELFYPPPIVNFSSRPQCMTRDPDVTAWGIPGCSVLVSESVNGKFIYRDTSYQFDHLGRRSCPQKLPHPNQHALFFGCSYTFGAGVTAENTLPCSFQSSTDIQSLNYAQNGFGTGEMYAILGQDRFFDSQIPTNGFALYDFIGDHLPRTVGSLDHLSSGSFYPDRAHYFYDATSDQIQTYLPADSFLINATVRALIAGRYLSPSLRYFAPHFPIQLESDSKGIGTLVALIAASRARYLKRFHGQFFVLLWPRSQLEEPLHTQFISLLAEKQIDVLIPPPLDPRLGRAELDKLDSHPSAAEHRWIADWLATKLNLQSDLGRTKAPLEMSNSLPRKEGRVPFF